MLSPACADVPAMVPPVPKTTIFCPLTCVLRKTGEKYSYWIKKQLSITVAASTGNHHARQPETHCPPATNSGSHPDGHCTHRGAAHPCRDRCRTGVQVGQRGRRTSPGAGAQRRDRAGQWHITWHPVAR